MSRAKHSANMRDTAGRRLVSRAAFATTADPMTINARIVNRACTLWLIKNCPGYTGELNPIPRESAAR